MTGVQWNDLFDQVSLVVIKYFQVRVAEQIEIYFIAVITYAHHTRAMLIQQSNLIVQ